MRQARNGDYVTVSYEGQLETGEVFETASEEEPLEFTIGQNSVFPSFEAATIGMQIGEMRTTRIGPAETYGQHRAELVQTINRRVFGNRIDPQPGMVLSMNMEREGQPHQVPAMIKAVAGDLITVDYNHPLAGHTLLYRITLLAIAESAGEEKATGSKCPSGDN